MLSLKLKSFFLKNYKLRGLFVFPMFTYNLNKQKKSGAPLFYVILKISSVIRRLPALCFSDFKMRMSNSTFFGLLVLIKFI